MKKLVEYIWLGNKGELRSKTRAISELETPSDWSFDGSSTGQSGAEQSDLILRPNRVIKDPFRGGIHEMVMCSVYTVDGDAVTSNYRDACSKLSVKHASHQCLFGMEQEYTLLWPNNKTPIGLSNNGFSPAKVPTQGRFYCAVGRGNVYGRTIAEKHLEACNKAGLDISGINAEVMPGQWEFQIGPCTATDVGDQIWLARYILHRICEKEGYLPSFKAKPHPKLNGAGMHTNFSTKDMRSGTDALVAIWKGAEALGINVVGPKTGIEENKTYETWGFPEAYGTGHEERLTGECETCSFKEFKFGIADRTASVRIPAHVATAGRGYLEDRRPCADADPYRVAHYMMETILGEKE